MPRTLAVALRPYVSSKSQARGASYFFGGRVTRIRSDSTSIAASVRGEQPYDVSLTLNGDRLSATCTCPYFEDHYEACKHIWAAILAADDAGSLQVPANVWLDCGEEEIDELVADPDEFELKIGPVNSEARPRTAE